MYSCSPSFCTRAFSDWVHEKSQWNCKKSVMFQPYNILWLFLLILRFGLIKYTIMTQFVLLLLETSFAARKRNKELLNNRKPSFIFVHSYGVVYWCKLLPCKKCRQSLAKVSIKCCIFDVSSYMLVLSYIKPILLLYNSYSYSC